MANDNTTVIATGTTGIDYAIGFTGVIISASDNTHLNCAGYMNENNYVMTYFDKATNNIKVIVPNAYKNGRYKLTMEYVKTT